jgi:hypothetical protein
MFLGLLKNSAPGTVMQDFNCYIVDFFGWNIAILGEDFFETWVGFSNR